MLQNFKTLKLGHIFIIITLIFLIFLIITLTLALLLLSNYKNKQLTSLKNLQYIQNLTIKERLTRIKQMVQTNQQYKPILNIWISRYQLFLKKDLKKIAKDYLEVIKLQNNQEKWKAFKLMHKVNKESQDLKHQIQLLTTEIDYFISIDQLQREYQLFFKQNFNFLQDQSIKINLQNNLNHQQINEIINIINDMFKELDTNVNDANFSQVVKILSEIAIAIVTLAEILANLPILNHLLTYEIKQKLTDLKNKCQVNNINNTLFLQYNLLERDINEQLMTIKRLINNLQYKKAKIKIETILQQIINFNSKINQEQIFREIFHQNYQRFLSLNLNFKQAFNKIKTEIETTIKAQPELEIEKQSHDLETIINKQLLSFDHVENILIVENEKTVKTTTYQQLLLLLKELFENSLILFNSLTQYNQLLNEQNKAKIKFDTYVNKINSMMLQIENILSNLNYYYLNQNYAKSFVKLQQTLLQLTLNTKIEPNDYDQQLANLNQLQNQVFQLYNQLKIEIMIHKLTHLTLIFANRHRESNEQLKDKFNEIEANITNNHYQKALTLLLELM